MQGGGHCRAKDTDTGALRKSIRRRWQSRVRNLGRVPQSFCGEHSDSRKASCGRRYRCRSRQYACRTRRGVRCSGIRYFVREADGDIDRTLSSDRGCGEEGWHYLWSGTQYASCSPHVLPFHNNESKRASAAVFALFSCRNRSCTIREARSTCECPAYRARRSLALCTLLRPRKLVEGERKQLLFDDQELPVRLRRLLDQNAED